MQERHFRALSWEEMEMNAFYCEPSWFHMLEEGGDARGMSSSGRTAATSQYRAPISKNNASFSIPLLILSRETICCCEAYSTGTAMGYVIK